MGIRIRHHLRREHHCISRTSTFSFCVAVVLLICPNDRALSALAVSDSDSGTSRSLRSADEVPFDDSYPWLIKLQTVAAFRCSGVLIAPNWVLTSASCFNGDHHATNYNVHLFSLAGGENTGDDFDLIPQITNTTRAPVIANSPHVHVQSFFIHGRYHLGDNSRHNLALVQLLSNVKSQHPPAELAESADDVSLDPCYSFGWGSNGTGNVESQHPTVRKWRLTKSSNCSSTFGQSDLLCAELLETSIGPCPGDEGSPLMCRGRNDKVWKVTALVSHNWRCGQDDQPSQDAQPTTFLDLEYYLPFIQKLRSRF